MTDSTDKPDLFHMLTLMMTIDEDDGDLTFRHGLVLGHDGKVSVLCFDRGIDDAQLWEIMHQQLADVTTAEIIFGLDRHGLPEHGVDTPSIVTVHHWKLHDDKAEGDYGWSFAVIPYDKDGFREIQYDNKFWNERMRLEIQRTLTHTTNRAVDMLKELGLPPEALTTLGEQGSKLCHELGRMPNTEEIAALIQTIKLQYCTGGHA